MLVLILPGAAALVGLYTCISMWARPRPPRPRYPCTPGVPMTDGLPGEPFSVPWETEHPEVCAAKESVAAFLKLADAGALFLVTDADLVLKSMSRPVAIGLIMEALAPIAAPALADPFASWYTEMAQVYFIDDLITDEAQLRAYHHTLPALSLENENLEGMLRALGYKRRAM